MIGLFVIMGWQREKGRCELIERIYCRNFRRIEEADIVLKEGITVVIGPNGSGKSSLMESVLFNLFGKVKSGTKKESVRRKGAGEEDPTFSVVDFSLGGIHYRCRRWYTKKMSLMATLYSYNDDEYAQLCRQKDIMALDKGLGSEVASSTTGVTKAVEDILGVSYDGFKASFMAQQKELDSLANLTLENRKKFFLDLLGYSKLDTIKPEISKQLKGIQTAASIIEKQNLSTAEIAKEISAHEKDIADKTARLAKGNAMTVDKKREYDEVAKAYEDSRAVSEKVLAFRTDIAALEPEKERLEAEIKQLEFRIAENKVKSAGYDATSPLASRIADLRDRAAKGREAIKAREDYEMLAAGIVEREKTMAANAASIAKLLEKTAAEPDMETPQSRITAIKETKAGYRQHRLASQASLSSMQELMASVEAGATAKCPTCGSEISTDEGRLHLQGEIDGLVKEISETKKLDAKADEEMKRADEELALAKMKVRNFQKDQAEKSRLEQENRLLSQQMDQSIRQRDAAAAKQEELASFTVSKAQLREMDEDIAQLNVQLARENEMKTAYYQLQQDLQSVEMKRQRLAEVISSLNEKGKYVKENSKLADAAVSLLEKRNAAEKALDKCREFLTKYEREKSQAEAMLEAARGNFKRATEQSAQLSKFKDDIEAHIGAQQVVEFLRKNLPARIAPRLALEAGHLLDIATNGRYTMIEIDNSYEVYIYTDDDIRPIAMMSGGEADVISLCIRIAIAKLILEATGVSEQTFILDEIFGALDDERRESTCLALQNIGKQLSKILCITHIDEIKDMADWTYAVEMDENGVSHVREVPAGPVLPTSHPADAVQLHSGITAG